MVVGADNNHAAFIGDFDIFYAEQCGRAVYLYTILSEAITYGALYYIFKRHKLSGRTYPCPLLFSGRGSQVRPQLMTKQIKIMLHKLCAH